VAAEAAASMVFVNVASPCLYVPSAVTGVVLIEPRRGGLGMRLPWRWHEAG
jgi:hypothetical protein